MPSARFWPAERIAASGVLSSWVTPATNSICWRARRRALCAPVARRAPVAPRSARTPKPTARLRRADSRHGLLQRPAPVPRDDQPGALLLGWPPPLPGGRGAVVGRSLAEARARDPVAPVGARLAPVGAHSAAAGQGALHVTGQGGQGARAGGVGREDDGTVVPPHHRHVELAVRHGTEVRLRELGEELPAQVVLVQLQQHHARDAEASPPLGGRLAGAGVHEREGEGQRVIERATRAG